MTTEQESDKTRWSTMKDSTTRMQRLWQRQTIINAIREDLNNEHFLEIETPLLVKGACPDAHIEPIAIEQGYLVTSTEYQIKRMIVGGFDKVYTLTKNFRANDRGRYHSSEFTMLEWARPQKSLDAIEDDAIRFIRKAFKRLYPDQNSLLFNGNQIDFMNAEWERVSVRHAFKKYLGLDDLEDFSLQPLLRATKAANLNIPPSFQEDKYLLISLLFDQLQIHLGKERPTFLQEWPAYLTTSAPLSKKDPLCAERSELYMGGIEIADGFPFLSDAHLQAKLFDEELHLRSQSGKLPVRIDHAFMRALEEGLPSGAGMALGIDRLVMVLTGSNRLADVQAFDWDEL